MPDGPRTDQPPAPASLRVRLGRRYTLALAAVLAVWIGMVAALVWLIYTRTSWLEQADQAHLREWLDESRVVRKTLPDLAGEYVAYRESGLPANDDSVVRKAEEIFEQLRALAEPMRMYQGYLPLFPDIYVLAVMFPGTDWLPIEWVSPVPQPHKQNETSVEVLDYPLPNRYGNKVGICTASIGCMHSISGSARRRAGSSSNSWPSASASSPCCRLPGSAGGRSSANGGGN